MAGVTVRVSPNMTVTGPDGVIYRAGDEFTIDDESTVAQWVSVGVVEVVSKPSRRSASQRGR